MSRYPKHILMVIDQFYPIIGGAETQALLLSRNLIKNGNSVTILTRKGKKELSPEETVDGINIHRVSISGSSGYHKIISIFPAVIWLIRNRSAFDIIHCHGCNPLEWSVLFTRPVIRKPYIVKLTRTAFLNYVVPASLSNDTTGTVTNIAKYLLYPVVKFIRKKMLKKSSTIIAINSEIINLLTGEGFSNVVKIPNGVDIEQYSPPNSGDKDSLRKKLHLTQYNKIFLYSGRFTNDKNIFRLLSAWNSFIKKHKKTDVHLILLGSSEIGKNKIASDLKEYVKQQNLTSVSFKGYVTNVTDYLRAADIFVLPSISEGLSNALLEAMACGLGIIASNILANRNLIEDKKNGLLFDPESIEELADCLKYFNDNEIANSSMGRSARTTIVDSFSISIITKKIVNEYDRLIYDNETGQNHVLSNK